MSLLIWSLLVRRGSRRSGLVGLGERASESSGFKIPAVSRRSGLLTPGVVHIATIDRVETKIVDEAKH